jgi:hypothetical protein
MSFSKFGKPKFFVTKFGAASFGEKGGAVAQ